MPLTLTITSRPVSVRLMRSSRCTIFSPSKASDTGHSSRRNQSAVQVIAFQQRSYLLGDIWRRVGLKAVEMLRK